MKLIQSGQGSTDLYQQMRTGHAFLAGTAQGATASKHSYVQLYNPVGSGVVAAVHRIVTQVSVGTTVYLYSYDTPLTNLSTVGHNKQIGGNDGACVTRIDSNANYLGTELTFALIQASTPYAFAEDWVCELDAGEGVQLVSGAYLTDLYGQFEWIELPLA